MSPSLCGSNTKTWLSALGFSAEPRIPPKPPLNPAKKKLPKPSKKPYQELYRDYHGPAAAHRGAHDADVAANSCTHEPGQADFVMLGTEI